MSCGIPIIVGDEDGSKEAIQNNLNGFSINPSRHDIHLEKLIYFESDLRNTAKMGNKSRDIVLDHFSYDIFLGKHQYFYESL